MKNYYGQHGEDRVLWALFKDQPGFYLDVGALDGKHFSNTLSFEEAGWNGICVEAHPYFIKYIKQNRPTASVVHAAIANQDKKNVVFYAYPRGSLSTLNPALEKYFKSKFKRFTGWEKIKVPMRTLNSILTEYAVEKVDVVSMDIEGGELLALQGFDIQKYQPRVLVIEAITKKHAVWIHNFMKENKYYPAKVISNNHFYCATKEDAAIINSTSNVCKRVVTVHPLDEVQQ